MTKEPVTTEDFWMMFRTFMNRQNILAGKLMKEEQELSIHVLASKAVLPPEIFNHIFMPMKEIIDQRIATMSEIAETWQDFVAQVGEMKKDLDGDKHDQS